MNVDSRPTMNGRPKFIFSLMGSTNSVQPYCRLAIITIVKMPTTNCVQRLRTMPAAGAPAAVAVPAIGTSPIWPDGPTKKTLVSGVVDRPEIRVKEPHARAWPGNVECAWPGNVERWPGNLETVQGTRI